MKKVGLIISAVFCVLSTAIVVFGLLRNLLVVSAVGLVMLGLFGLMLIGTVRKMRDG